MSAAQPPQTRNGVFTEVDIVRHIVKDLIESYNEDKHKKKTFMPIGVHAPPRSQSQLAEDEEQQESMFKQKKTVFKLYMRIWITCVRQIRNMCEKHEGKPVELRHIGVFFKPSDSNNFAFVPNEDLLYDAKIRVGTENEENYKKVPSYIINAGDGKINQINYHTVAQICECKVDLVQTFLNRVKQVIVEMLSQKGVNQLLINLRFGQIHIQKTSGELEFKTLHNITDHQIPLGGALTQSKLAHLGGGHHYQSQGAFDQKSVSQMSYYSRPALSQTKSTVESNIRSFQSLQQSNGKGYINASYAPSQISQSPSQAQPFACQLNHRSASVKGDPFSTLQQLKAPDTQSKVAGNSLNHLRNFLQTQQNMYKTNIDQLSTSNPIKNADKYIQQIADLKKLGVASDAINSRVNKYSQLNIEEWRKARANNTNGSFSPEPRKSLGHTSIDKKSNVGKPPVTAHVASKYKTNENVKPESDKQSMQPLKIEPQIKTDNPPTTMGRNFATEWRTSNTMSVGGALNLQRGLPDLDPLASVKPQVYTQMPAFMRSDGPFTVYNHHKAKGDEYFENFQLTKSEAKQRLQEQLYELRKRKELEKKHFMQQIATEEENFKIQQEIKRLQHIENQQYVKMQIDSKNKSKRFETDEDKSYNTKSHYGPEENDEVANMLRKKKKEQQDKVKNAYLQQMQLTTIDKKLEKELELAKDTKDLEAILEMQSSEEQAKKLLREQNQAKLKKAWIEQMEFKKIKQEYEKIFD